MQQYINMTYARFKLGPGQYADMTISFKLC